MASGRLNLHERYRIHALSEAGHSVRTVDRSPSMISRELRRNRTGRRYQPETAHRLACARVPVVALASIPDASKRLKRFWPRIIVLHRLPGISPWQP